MSGRTQPPKIVVGLRGEGRTHALITWLMHGKRISGWPGWSRILVVADDETARRLPRSFPGLQTQLHQLNTGGLGKLVLSLNGLERLRGVQGVEVALDDAEHLLGDRRLRALPSPSVIAMTGEAVSPAELNAPTGVLRTHAPLAAEQVAALARRYKPRIAEVEEEQRYEPSLTERVSREIREAVEAVDSYEQRKFDHDVVFGHLPVTDPIRCLAEVRSDADEQHCGQRGSWLRGRPGILSYPGMEHPQHGWMGHESGWKAVRCPGGDRLDERVRMR